MNDRRDGEAEEEADDAVRLFSAAVRDKERRIEQVPE
jgi:hypothetical protein